MAKKIINMEHEGKFRENSATGHNHSYYSLNDAPQSPKEYVKRCKELGFTSAALNDHGTLLGVYAFMDACKEYGINGVPGIETYTKVCPEVMERLSKYSEFLRGRTHLILNSVNYKGYQAICFAAKDAYKNLEFLIKLTYPIMTGEMIEKHFSGNNDIFATSACVQGAIGYILLTNKRIKAQLEKEHAICDKFAESYEAFKKANDAYKSAAECAKEKKKEFTAYSKFLKQAHLDKIEKLKNQIRELEDAGKTEAKSYITKTSSLVDAVSSFEEAKKCVPELESQMLKLQTEKESLKAEADVLKKGASKYLKAKEKIDEQPFISEEELYECAKIQLMYYKNIFPKFFIELQYHEVDSEEYAMPLLLKLAEETNTPIIAANDAHVSNNTEKDFETRRIIRFNYFKKAQATEPADRHVYIKSDWELIDALATIIPRDKAEEAVRNTDIFNQCNVVFPDEKHYPSVKDTDESFDSLLQKARAQKIADGAWNDVYEKRLLHEIDTIKTMGFVDYHMVVRDFCNEARRLGCIPRDQLASLPDDFDAIHEYADSLDGVVGVGVGPGRGSAAGSLVCYLLGITNIDPIKYNLLFERFLNPERVSMPDIDSDIKTSLRPLIVKYLPWKYGRNAVCSISTETTYCAKNAVKMAGRDRASQKFELVYDKKEADLKMQKYLYEVTEKVSKIIPETPGVTLADCESSFKSSFSGNEEACIIWERAKLLEGKISGTGIHAGGVIISDNENINEYVALAYNADKQVWAAQCDMIKAEEIGLLKVDLLGLSTLDFISDCQHLVKKHHNVSIDINKIPFEAEVFENIYARGNTNSVFQFESDGMKSMLKEFKPTCFEDLIILVACYRPGPMQYLEDIIAVKNGRKKPSYKTPELEEILCTTYGAIVYQEQVMQLFQKLAGYSLGGADMVRRAMSKKKEKVLLMEKKAFVDGDAERGIDGCVKRGIDRNAAVAIFDEVMDFAKYAFNKSHAASYALVSYQTAYLKYHYPLEYLCAMFNNKQMESFNPLYADCDLYGIKMLPPDVNKSFYDFSVEGDNIRFGFFGIKNIGETKRTIIDSVIKNRESGEYASYTDFLLRNAVIHTNDKGARKAVVADKDTLSAMIQSGCFDSLFPYSRESLMASATVSLDIPAGIEDAESYVQNFITNISVEMLPKNTAYNMTQESFFLGTILSEHPLDNYKDDADYGCVSMDSLKTGKASVFGFVTSAELKKSKKGNNMIILDVQGKHGSCRVFVMRNLYDTYSGKLDELEHHVIKISGSVNDGGTIFADSINGIQSGAKEHFIDLKTKEDTVFMVELRNLNIGERYIPVNVMIHYSKSRMTGELMEKVPKIHCFNFSDEEMEAVRNQGIKIQDA